MESIIIYGVGNTGKNAYKILKGIYNVLFFVDKDSAKWGSEYKGIKI